MNDRDNPPRRDLEPSVGELIESAVRKIVTGIVIAGGLIAIGLYSQAGPARSGSTILPSPAPPSTPRKTR